MYISDLSLDDFRSYQQLVLHLEPGVTSFIGANGQGKTNLVEAVGYLAHLSSHRVGADTALVRRAAPGQPQPAGAVIRAKVIHGERPTVMEVEILAGKANRARLGRASVRPRDLLGVLRCVIFAPEDLSLVREEPGVRRRFLDDLAVTMRPSLASIRSQHDKILTQRASLLKSARASRRPTDSMIDTLEVWDSQLAAAAATLIAARVDIVRRLRPWLAQAYAAVSGGHTPTHLAYRSSLLLHEGEAEPDPRHATAEASEDDETSWPIGEKDLLCVEQITARLETAMKHLHAREIDRGANLVGAHRDDLSLFLHHLPAKGFASHGEQWSLALALRIASYEMLRHDVDAFAGDGEPILILDDVFASLDDQRRRALTSLVADAQQVLLTAAVAEDVPAELAGARITIDQSQVRL